MSFLKNKVLFGIAFLILLNITFAFVQENQVGSYYAHNSILSPIKGVTVVAPPKPLNTKSLLPLANIQAEWVAFVPYGFSRKGSPSVSFNLDRQWWGERSEGIESSIITAREVGLNVMLKPQVYIGGGWVGDMDFESESDWKKWEENYAAYIKEFARIAAKHNVEMFCIGTEYNVAVKKRSSFWKQLIKDVRQTYKGQLIYSANWDNYQDVPFWDDLDYIGISSYFPLSDAQNPTINLLYKEWKPIKKTLKSFSRKHNKKIIFTEYGYLSVDGCAGKTWELEKNIHSLTINHQAQCNAYDALWSSFIEEDFWGGGFLWKWFPDNMGHEGYFEKDYTPQEKPAEKVLKKWFNTSK